VTPRLARALLSAQHPDLARLPIVHVEHGWDNVMFRLGERLALRIPRRREGALLILKEQRWLGEVAQGLPLPAPVPVRAGKPGEGYPWSWSVVPWFEGEPADLARPGPGSGEALAEFMRALHRPAPPEAPPNPWRGVPLANRADAFEARFGAAASAAPECALVLRRLWTAALEAPAGGVRLWLHGDPHARNVLVRDQALAAVIDWGDLAAGDPASDLAAVWMLLPDRAERAAAMETYGGDEALWARARGWAAMMSVLLLPITNNARMPAMARATARRLEEGP